MYRINYTMRQLIFLVLFSTAVSTIYAQDGIAPEPHPSHNTTIAPETTTSNVTTTETPHTTTLPTVPTTKPTTPSTPPPTTPSTTPAPPTTPSTTPAPTTPAPAPPTPIDPPEGTWNVTYPKSNETCIRIHFALQVQIPYHHVALNATVNTTVDIPSDAMVDGDCIKDDQTIIIHWLNKNNATDSLTFNFLQNATAKNYKLKDISLVINPDATFPGIDKPDQITLTHEFEEFQTSLLKSYKCDKQQQLNLTDSADKKPRGYIFVKHLQMQAFANSTDNSFYNAEDCAPFDTPDVVPIAVGCALAALVIIVLIAYLIGRRRRQARGYLSM